MTAKGMKETVWFEYSATKSDYYLHCPNILFLFLIFSLVPLPLVFLELARSSSAWFDRYKIQPYSSWTHDKYDFPWTLTNYVPFYGGAEYHDYHHYVGGQSQSNFASVFTYCDYIYGTDKGYRLQKKLLLNTSQTETCTTSLCLVITINVYLMSCRLRRIPRRATSRVEERYWISKPETPHIGSGFYKVIKSEAAYR
ncbi:hypothetical protein YC2023_031776 [Brassica napus]